MFLVGTVYLLSRIPTPGSLQSQHGSYRASSVSLFSFLTKSQSYSLQLCLYNTGGTVHSNGNGFISKAVRRSKNKKECIILFSFQSSRHLLHQLIGKQTSRPEVHWKEKNLIYLTSTQAHSMKKWDKVGPKLSTNKTNIKLLMRWGECHEADVLSSVDCRWLFITVFSDAHLQTALSPGLLGCSTDEVYLILKNITRQGKKLRSSPVLCIQVFKRTHRNQILLCD